MTRPGLPAAVVAGLALVVSLLVPHAATAATSSDRGSEALPAPTGLTVKAGNQRAKLTWTAPDDARVNGFEVTRYPGGEVIPLPNGTDALVDFGLTNGQTYRYTIASVGSDSYARSQEVEFPLVTPAARPGRPHVKRAACAHGRLAVTWQPADDRGSAVTRYRVRVGHRDPVDLGPQARRAVVHGVQRSEGVLVRVKARNALGWGDWAQARCR